MIPRPAFATGIVAMPAPPATAWANLPSMWSKAKVDLLMQTFEDRLLNGTGETGPRFDGLLQRAEREP